MPILISTPEQWFRTRQCDFFEIRLIKGQKGIPKRLLNWFAVNLREPTVHVLGSSERSGWISGGPTMSVVAMDEDEVQAFSDRWEDETGKSNDPKWQCYQYPVSYWREKFERIDVFKGLPPSGSQYRWLLCDAGLYWLRGNYADNDEKPNDSVGLPCMDDWWWVCQKFPEVHEATQSRFCMGYDVHDYQKKRIVAFDTFIRRDGDIGYESFFDDTGKKQEAIVRAALELPAELEISDSFF